MEKVNLKLGERLTLMQILPKEGNITTISIIDELQKSLGVTEEEHRNFEIKLENGTLQWNPIKDVGRDFEVGPVATKIISEELNKLNEATPPKLTIQHLPLWNLFCKDIKEE